ncbi:efflux RND transporter permease subunit [Halanaerobium salsuginis]|jgi:HAE1 family hydrophobic/amphiphilic exporter-1|uniref:Hydrophobic/amphiphilic exporter-1, HAE1 family n=1 Tax=Halanaerobium salsuginis TaxID=29563 RepID=A0A1I4LMY5_9FIRM|nr:efflux RND transporter permease subunit [Halanaerobium salsuginis]SFL92374.1 hydrophobic/amphiphilic exporter-1, HAE1 family [Halanaerobium salsuginis]
MKLAKLAVERPVTITMFILVIILIGTIALGRLPMDLTPDIEIPFLMITTSYSGASPEEIEELITRPIEQTVATLDGLDTLSTTSSEGYSRVRLELNYGTDLTEAKNDLRDLVSQIESRLPDEADQPRIRNFDPNSRPIIELSLAGLPATELKKIAENNIQPELEKINGVASAEVTGGREREIRINVDQEQLATYQITLAQIANTIRASNRDGSLGSVMVGKQEISVRAKGKFKDINDLKNLAITTSAGDKIPLVVLAKIEDGYQEINSLSYLNGQESVGISIQKQGDSNTVAVAAAVKKEVIRLQAELNGADLEITSNNAQYIEDSIAGVKQNFIIGGLLAVVVLFAFLRNLSSTFVIATAIPISVLATFALMFFADLSLNIITLGGIALGVGMLLDNSIVVLENIYRHRALGTARIAAAREGASEVSSAIFASTLTTAAVFLPVIFIQDMLAQLFTPMALTVTFSLFASLFVALTFIPMLSSKILKVTEQNQQEDNKANYLIFYRKLLQWALANRVSILILVVIFFSIFIAGIIFEFIPLKTEYMPSSDQGTVRIRISMPDNSTIEQTDKVVKQLQQSIADLNEIKLVTTRVWGDNARFTVELVDQSKRDKNAAIIAEEIRQRTANIAGPQINVSADTSMMHRGGGDTAVEVLIKGPDLNKLLELGQQTRELLATINGVRNSDLSLDKGNPEIHVRINQQLADFYGIEKSELIDYVNMALSGSTIDHLTEGGTEIDIVLKLADSASNSLNNLQNIKLFTNDGQEVLLSQLAEIIPGRGYSAIDRENQQRLITISSDIFERPLGEVQPEIEKLLADQLNLPSEYTIDYGGEAEEMASSFKQLFLAVSLAILLVYMVMAAQFESLLYPFIIMFTVPLAIVGAILSLVLTGLALSVNGMIGMIMLVGIVVNNAIVMIDYINHNRITMGRKKAILAAAPIRLRPILMTTSTTILALIPLALGIGTGAETQQPMAVVVIGGLLFSTLLTLIIIPVIYDIVDQLRLRVISFWQSKFHHEK